MAMERCGKTLDGQPFAGAMIYLAISTIFMFINIRLFIMVRVMEVNYVIAGGVHLKCCLQECKLAFREPNTTTLTV